MHDRLLKALLPYLSDVDLTDIGVDVDVDVDVVEMRVQAPGPTHQRHARPAAHPRSGSTAATGAGWPTCPGQPIGDEHVFTRPWPAAASDKRRDHTYFYSYSASRARKTLHGIDEQVRKAEQAVAGKTAVKRNRFVTLAGATKTVNRVLEGKARALAGIKGYVTNLPNPEPAEIIGTYSRLLNIEKSFRMSKSDLAARPIFHHERFSIEAHLTIVFAALAVSRGIEARTGWSIRKFVTTARRYREITIQAGDQTIKAADPLPDDLQAALDAIHHTH